LLNLLAQALEALQSLLHVGLPGGPADLDLQLVDSGLQRLLAVLDRALELAADVGRHAPLSVPQGLSSRRDRASDKA
jgi:hypothetical protein